jgi:L-proline amide hydrolase
MTTLDRSDAIEGRAAFEGNETWYLVVGNLESARSGTGPAPLVTLHGGPGATHDYMLSMTDLTASGRTVIFYDQLGNGNSTHLRDQAVDFWTVDLFVRELANLIGHLGIGDRYHVLGQSWGGMLAQEHALTQPAGLRSIVLSDTAASFGGFAVEANKLRADLPPGVDAAIQRHEDAGTTDDPEYLEACLVFYSRHLCRLDPWPDEMWRTFNALSDDPTVYGTTNGPSEFHVIGTFKDWSVIDRLGEIRIPTLVISGRHDEATPALQEVLVGGIDGSEQVMLEESSHTPFIEERELYMSAVGAFLARHD